MHVPLAPSKNSDASMVRSVEIVWSAGATNLGVKLHGALTVTLNSGDSNELAQVILKSTLEPIGEYPLV